METIRLGCIFTRILGGRTFSRVLQNRISEDGRFLPNVIYLENDDYREFPAPSFLRVSNALESAFVIKSKAKARRFASDDVDGYVFQGYQLTLFFARQIAQKIAILALDETPATARAANRWWSNKSGAGVVDLPRLLMAWGLDRLVFRRIFKRIDYFLARTEKVRSSLINDYGVDAARIELTYMPIEEQTKGDAISTGDPIRLLFVGADFERKGGNFLAELFDEELAESAELTIVSDDPKFSVFEGRPGARVLPSMAHEDLIKLMQGSDLLLFPSYRDALGLVICEAIASGMAVMTRDCGAQKELVNDNFNGRLMIYASSVDEWKSALKAALSDRQVLQQWKANARIAHKELLDPSVFDAKVKRALDFLAKEIRNQERALR